MTDPTLNDNFILPPDLTDCEPPPEGSQEPPSVQDLTRTRPRITEPSPNRWPPQLVFDLALGLDCDEDTLTQRYAITPQDLETLFTLPLFRQEVALMTRELREKNTIFKVKAKTQAEEYLKDMHDLMADGDTPASTKLSIFQTLAKYGELEPDKTNQGLLSGQNLQPGQSMRMIVEWSGGTTDYSPVAQPKEIDVTP
jgi:hypothetical protein